MKIKNYEWNGFGFPIIFEELPAVKLRGELVPDVDFELMATPVIQYICVAQDTPFCGNQVKFIRHHFKMSLREFAKFILVKHQSVMRWEKRGKATARIDAHIEFVMRIKILKALNSSSMAINAAVDTINVFGNQELSNRREFSPLWISESAVQSIF